jgi:hypothetical protein
MKPIWRRWEPSEGMAGTFSGDSVRIEPDCKVRNDMGLAGCFQWESKLLLDGQGYWVRESASIFPAIEDLSVGHLCMQSKEVGSKTGKGCLDSELQPSA